MRTTKPTSTISFNTQAYLELKLKELQKAKIISFWAFVPHLPEDDEAGLKHHFHVFVEPSKMLQTEDLKEQLKEFDPAKPDKPLGCLVFRGSKFDDWYLYSIHDAAYLASKGMSRKYHYQFDDVVSSDKDDLLFRVRMINRVQVSPYAAMLDAQQHGVTWEEYFSRGTVPIPQIRQFEAAWYMLLKNITCRAGRENHPMEVDDDPVINSGAIDDYDYLETAKREALQRVYDKADLKPLDPDEELPF